MMTLGQSSIRKGTALLGIIFFAIRTEPVSRPISGMSALLSGCVLMPGRCIGLLSRRSSDSLRMSSGSTTAGAMVQ